MILKESHQIDGYIPNKGAALTFALLFGLLAFTVAFLTKLQYSKDFRELKDWKSVKFARDRPPLRWCPYLNLAGSSAPLFLVVFWRQ